MTKISVTFEIDENILLKDTKNTETDNLEVAIQQEMDSLRNSGIYALAWEFVEA